MESSIAVANFFIKKALETNSEITPMKLVKLVYIAHGWYLGLTGEPLIKDEVQAWKYGPVIPTLYHVFKKYKHEKIKHLESEFVGYQLITPLVSDPTKVRLLDKIWEVYGKFDGVYLSALTHEPNTPWYFVWEIKGGKMYQSATIPNEVIENHYKLMSKQQ